MRLLSIATLGVVCVLLSLGTASAFGRTSHALDSCNTQGSDTNCIYAQDATFTAHVGLTAQAYDYWVTNTMWRPSGECAIVAFNNGSLVGSVEDCSPSDNHFSTYGPYGYSRGYCKNDTSADMNHITCEDFNYHT